MSVTRRRCSDTLHFQGWLSEHRVRRGSTTLRLSSQRWCVLTGQQLFVFDSQGDEKPSKIIHLPLFRVVLSIPQTADADNVSLLEQGSTTGQGSEVKGHFILELRPKQSRGDVYMFVAENEEAFNNWAQFLSLSSSSKGEDIPHTTSGSLKDSQVVSSSESGPAKDSKVKAMDQEPRLTSVPIHLSDNSNSDVNPHRHLGRAWSSPESKHRAQTDFLKILEKADFTFWEEEGQEEDGEDAAHPPKIEKTRSSEAINIESCLLAPSTRKSPNTSPGTSPPPVRRSDIKYCSLPPPRLQMPPKKLQTDTKKSPSAKSVSPSSSPSLRKRVSKRLGSSWDRNSWAGERSPQSSRNNNRKSAGLGGSLSPADFAESYGLFESRSTARLKEKSTKGEGKGGVAKDIISLVRNNYLKVYRQGKFFLKFFRVFFNIF